MSITHKQTEQFFPSRAQTSFQIVHLVSGILDELMKITEKIPIDKSK